MKDVGWYCRTHNLTWDEFWAKSKTLEASVNAKRTERGAEHDTPPTPFAFYHPPVINLPSGDQVWLYGWCLTGHIR